MTNYVKVKLYDVKNNWFKNLDYITELELKKGDHVVIPGHKDINMMKYGTVTSRTKVNEKIKRYQTITERYSGELNMPTKEEAYKLRENTRKDEDELRKKFRLAPGETSYEFEKYLAELRSGKTTEKKKGFFARLFS